MTKNEDENTPTLQLLTEPINPTDAMRLASDPIDALRLASDLYAMDAYRAERRLTALARVPGPPAPQPISNVMRRLQAMLKAKLCAIIELLEPHDRARLHRLAPAASQQLDLGDADLTEEIARLATMPVEDAVAWVRERLDANDRVDA